MFPLRFLLLPLVALALIPGCGHYQPKQLKHLTRETAMYEQTNEKVTLRVQPLDKKETKALFGGRGDYLFSKKATYYPIHITIFNKSNNVLLLTAENINLNMASKDAVIAAMQYDTTMGTVVPLLIGAAGITACAIANSGSRYGTSATVVDTLAIGGVSGAIAADNNGKAKSANEVIADDVTEKMLSSDGLVIKPFDKNSVVIFVEKRFFKPHFTITLQRDNGTLMPFDVQI